ncbi:MAG: hypothetical protein IJ121_05715 [Eubacterium sp.]|nr:hypothetical protein [Eubacterium sp.]
MALEFRDARKYKKQIAGLYHRAFPLMEKLPLAFLYRRAKRGIGSFDAIVEDGMFSGLMYTMKLEKLVCLYYFAIEENRRGRGTGGEVIRMLRERYPDCAIVLLIEDTSDPTVSNYTQRIGRVGFYERGGFRQLRIHIKEAGVAYELLGTDSSITKADYLLLMRKFFGGLLYRILYGRQK